MARVLRVVCSSNWLWCDNFLVSWCAKLCAHANHQKSSTPHGANHANRIQSKCCANHSKSKVLSAELVWFAKCLCNDEFITCAMCARSVVCIMHAVYCMSLRYGICVARVVCVRSWCGLHNIHALAFVCATFTVTATCPSPPPANEVYRSVCIIVVDKPSVAGLWLTCHVW